MKGHIKFVKKGLSRTLSNISDGAIIAKIFHGFQFVKYNTFKKEIGNVNFHNFSNINFFKSNYKITFLSTRHKLQQPFIIFFTSVF